VTRALSLSCLAEDGDFLAVADQAAGRKRDRQKQDRKYACCNTPRIGVQPLTCLDAQPNIRGKDGPRL